MDAVDIFYFDRLQQKKQENIQLVLVVLIAFLFIVLYFGFKFFEPKKVPLSTTYTVNTVAVNQQKR